MRRDSKQTRLRLLLEYHEPRSRVRRDSTATGAGRNPLRAWARVLLGILPAVIRGVAILWRWLRECH